MQYYSEKQTGFLRVALESEVLHWARIGFRKMFGCPCYKVNEKLFAFLVTGGLVFTHLNETDRTELSSKYQTTSFKAGQKEMKNWIQVSIGSTKELQNLMPFVRRSYEEARKLTD